MKPLRLVGLGVGVALVAALAFVAGGQNQTLQTSDRSKRQAEQRARVDDESPIGRLLAAPRRVGDLPLGYESGATFPYPGDSYRLLFDARPNAASSTSRWRVWIGVGVDARELCVYAAFDSTRATTTCLTSTALYEGDATIRSPLGAAPLEVQIRHGAVMVDGSPITR